MLKKAFFSAIIVISLLMPASAQQNQSVKKKSTPESIRALIPPAIQTGQPAQKDNTQGKLRTQLPGLPPEVPVTTPGTFITVPPAASQTTPGGWNAPTQNQVNYPPCYYRTGQNCPVPAQDPRMMQYYPQNGSSTDSGHIHYYQTPLLKGPFYVGPLIKGNTNGTFQIWNNGNNNGINTNPGTYQYWNNGNNNGTTTPGTYQYWNNGNNNNTTGPRTYQYWNNGNNNDTTPPGTYQYWNNGNNNNTTGPRTYQYWNR